MIEIDEARRLIVAQSKRLSAVERPTVQSVGCILAGDILADVDSPPHDKALVDGFAVRASDVAASRSDGFELLEQVIAGALPTVPVIKGTVSQVMTGAPIPNGADAMVMVEDSEIRDNRVYFKTDNISSGQAIMRRAATFAKGEVVVPEGTLIRPIEVGLLSEVGREQVSCFRRPTVSVLPTGEELVPARQLPDAGQIRNSNGPMLEAALESWGCQTLLLDVAKDNQRDLRDKIERGVESDVLVLSGGVSAGTRDLVPPTLALLGVECVFHKVSLKPGKPIWFGVRDVQGHRTLVFGLPGNPVSSLVCLELFVKAAIRSLAGRSPDIEWQPIRLAADFNARGNRPTFWPANWQRREGRIWAEPIQWRGSSDMLSVARADCFIYFDRSPREYRQGEKLQAFKISE